MQKPGRWSALAAGMALAWLLALPGLAHAQRAEGDAPADADMDNLMLRLNEAEQSYQYAQKALRAGDIKSAISSLERVLLLNPDLPNIKLELGLLYLETGQSALGAALISSAMEDPGAPPEARRRARVALAQADRDLSAFSFSGYASASVKYDTNPNAAPDAVSVFDPFFQRTVVITRESGNLVIIEDPDYSLDAQLSGELAYAFGGQMGHELVADAQVSTSLYGEYDELNSTSLAGRLGPRFYLGSPTNPAGSIRPYVTASQVHFSDEELFSAAGGGVTADYRIGLGLRIGGFVQIEERDFATQAAIPLPATRNGQYGEAAVGFDWRASPRFQFFAGVNGETVDADTAFQSRERIGVTGGFSTFFDFPGVESAARATLRLGYSDISYSAPDASVNPLISREEQRAAVGVEIAIPFEAFQIELGVDYAANASNLPNYEFNNTSVQLGVSRSF